MKDKSGIEIIKTIYWDWIVNHDFSKEKYKVIEEEFEKEFHGCIGKYLFFSENKEELIELAKVLLVKYDLHQAKTPSFLGAGYSEYVLCVYDAGPNLLKEMEQYKSDTISYRYWKSDEQTIKGE